MSRRANGWRGRLAPAAALIAAACGTVEYDFDLGDPPDAGDPSAQACEELPVTAVGCPGGAGSCDGAASVETARLEVAVGCSPAGTALGVARLEAASGQGAADLFAWIEPGAGDEGPFAGAAALSLFGAKCDNPVGGEPGLNCAFEPYLIEAALGIEEPLYLHVQTAAPGAATVGLQVLPRDEWRAALPAGGEPLSCRLSDGQVLSDLVAQPPWGGAPVALDASRIPPALEGEPWICASAGGGWRQVAFLLRNQEDGAVRITRLGLEEQGAPGAAARFHYGLYRCLDEGGVPSEIDALASSCHDAGDHASKNADVVIEPWVPGVVETEHVLVLQVPPGPARLFELSVDSEPAAAR